MRPRTRCIRAALLATTILGAPGLAHADPVTLTALAATAAGAATSGALTGAVIAGVTISATAASLIGTVVTAGLGFLGQQLFAPKASSDGQQSTRTRKFETHPAFRLVIGEVPLEGSVVFHHVVGETYYVAYLLNSVPSAARGVDRIVINDVIELDIPGIKQPENADYNGVAVLQDLYDMQLGAGAQDPAPYGVSDAPDLKFWLGDGFHSQAPQQWLDEIGPNGTAEAGVLKDTDTWSGVTMLFARFVDDNPKLTGDRYSHGRPPPIKVFGKWSMLYDPRLDPTSGVTQLGQVAISMALTDPPADPADGDTYVPAATATGAWTGHEDEVAVWDAAGGAWGFTAPTDGQTIWNLADHSRHAWNAATPAWELDRAGHDFDDVTTWEWSQNASLANLLLATHRFALGFDTELIPIQQVADAADDADAEFSATATIVGDPAPANLALLLQFTGDFSDAGAGHTVSPNSVVIENNQARFVDDGNTFLHGLRVADLETVGELRPGDKEFDFSAKITPDNLAPSQPTMHVLGQYDSGTVRSYRLRVLADGSLEFAGYGVEGNVGGTSDAGTQVISLTTDAGAITPGVQQTVRVWRKGDDWRMSVDGTEVASDLGHAATLYTGGTDIASFVMGRWENNRDPFYGLMDDVQIVINQVVETPLADPWGVNGVVLIRQRELGLLDPVLNTMAGQLDTTGGLLGWRAGVWKAPVDTLVQPSAGEVSVKGARDAGFDTVRASFIWAGNDWEETDGPGYALRAGARVHSLEQPLVAAHEQAAKLEKQFAERAEPLHTVEGVWDGVEADRRVGERVNFALFGLDRTSSTYMVVAKQPVIEIQDDGALRLAVRMTLEEDLQASYAWTIADYQQPAASEVSVLPTSNFGAVSSVVAAQENYASTDGGTVSARLAITITLSADVAAASSGIEAQYTESATGETGWLPLDVISVETGKLTYVVYKDPVLTGLTYAARARPLRTLEGGASAAPWLTSNSVTITTPVRAFTNDFTGAFT